MPKTPDIPKQTLQRLRTVVRKVKVMMAQRLAAEMRAPSAPKPPTPEKGGK